MTLGNGNWLVWKALLTFWTQFHLQKESAIIWKILQSISILFTTPGNSLIYLGRLAERHVPFVLHLTRCMYWRQCFTFPHVETPTWWLQSVRVENGVPVPLVMPNELQKLKGIVKKHHQKNHSPGRFKFWVCSRHLNWKTQLLKIAGLVEFQSSLNVVGEKSRNVTNSGNWLESRRSWHQVVRFVMHASFSENAEPDLWWYLNAPHPTCL